MKYRSGLYLTIAPLWLVTAAWTHGAAAQDAKGFEPLKAGNGRFEIIAGGGSIRQEPATPHPIPRSIAAPVAAKSDDATANARLQLQVAPPKAPLPKVAVQKAAPSEVAEPQAKVSQKSLPLATLSKPEVTKPQASQSRPQQARLPQADLPKADQPQEDTPKADLPKAAPSRAEAPRALVQEVAAAQAAVPHAEASQVSPPQTEMQNIASPEGEPLQDVSSVVDLPPADLPQAALQQPPAPRIDVPQTASQQVALPQADLPESDETPKAEGQNTGSSHTGLPKATPSLEQTPPSPEQVRSPPAAPPASPPERSAALMRPDPIITSAVATQQPPLPAVTSVIEDNMRVASNRDVLMAEALRRARGSLDAFLATVSAPPPGASGFAVKVLVGPKEAREALWVSGLERRAQRNFLFGSSERWTGRLANSTTETNMLKIGDQISFDVSEIRDWTYVSGGRTMGNFTACALTAPDGRARLAALTEKTGIDCGWVALVTRTASR